MIRCDMINVKMLVYLQKKNIFFQNYTGLFPNNLNPIYIDTAQLNWTSSWVELCRYKWGFRDPIICCNAGLKCLFHLPKHSVLLLYLLLYLTFIF